MVPYNNTGRVFPPSQSPSYRHESNLVFPDFLTRLCSLSRSNVFSFAPKRCASCCQGTLGLLHYLHLPIQVEVTDTRTNLTLTVNISANQRVLPGELYSAINSAQHYQINHCVIKSEKRHPLTVHELEKKQSERPIWKAMYGLPSSQCVLLYAPLTSFRVLHLSRNLPNRFKNVAINYAIYEYNFYLYNMVLVPVKPAHTAANYATYCMYE